jgi:hypothetical protein
MFTNTSRNVRDVIVLVVVAAAAAAGVGAMLLSHNAANAPANQTVQLWAYQPASDAATGGGYPSAPQLIESDRGVIPLNPQLSSVRVISGSVGTAVAQSPGRIASAQIDKTDVLSRYAANTAMPELVSDAASSGGYPAQPASPKLAIRGPQH